MVHVLQDGLCYLKILIMNLSIAGQRMQHVNALFRYPVMIGGSDTLTVRLKNVQMKDYEICTIKGALRKGDFRGFFC